MADPRLTPMFDGIDDVMGTFLTDGVTIVYDSTKVGGSASVGLAVSMSGNSTVQLTADAQAVVGKLILVEYDGHCTVQIGGFCVLPGGNAAALTLGAHIVGALGAAGARGYIRAMGAVVGEAVVADGQIIDATDPANVIVSID